MGESQVYQEMGGLADVTEEVITWDESYLQGMEGERSGIPLRNVDHKSIDTFISSSIH